MTTKTSRYLTRFEDAELSRQQLLALQKHPLKGQPTIAEKVLEKHQSKRLKKRLRGKGGRIGKGRRGGSEAIKGRPKVEEDLEFQRDKLRQEKAETARKEGELRAKERRDTLADLEARAEGVRRDRELTIADRTQQAIATAAYWRTQQADVASQREAWLRVGDRQAQLQIADREVQQRIADRQAQAQLEDRRQELATAQIAAGNLQAGWRRGVADRRIDEEARRFDADLQERQRDRRDVQIRHLADLEGVRERNAREDERRAREQQERFDQAARELAERGKERETRDDNERFRDENERIRIETERSRDAERAETDRERERTLQRLLTMEQRQGSPEFFHTGGGGGGGGGSGLPELQRAVEDVGERSLERQRTGTPPPTSPLSAPSRGEGSEERRRREQLEQLGGVPFEGSPPEPAGGGGGGGETASQRALRIRETPISPGTPTRWGGGGEFGGMGTGRLSPRWPQSGPGSLEEQTLRQQERQDEPSERHGFQSPRSGTPPRSRRWTRGDEPHGEQEATPGTLRETPTQERIHNVGGQEGDRPSGLDRTGLGPVEETAEDRPLGRDE
tara:strand:- start:1765 stop:3462 length:1698 start_codon:yes stop_codon:yes gene_type:complete